MAAIHDGDPYTLALPVVHRFAPQLEEQQAHRQVAV